MTHTDLIQETVAFVTTLREQQVSWTDIWHMLLQRYAWRPWTSAEQVRSWYRRASVSFLLPKSEAYAVEAETTLRPNGVTLVFADLHIPYQYEPMIEQAILRWTPDHIVLAGDTFDFDELSQFPRDHRTVLLEDELALAGQVLYALSQAAPVTMLMGNHERRILRVLQTPLSFQRLVSLTGVTSIKALQREYLFLYDTIAVGHGWSSAIAGKEAARLAEKHQRHVLLGHNHQCGVSVTKTNPPWIGASIGCSCRFESMWYQARRMHAFMYQRGYAVIFPDESFFVCDETHAIVAGVWSLFGTKRVFLHSL